MVTIYFGTLLIVFIIAHVGINAKYRSTAISILSLIVIVSILVAIAGFRSENSIGDTSAYAHSYRLLAQNPIIGVGSKDIGFSLFMLFLLKISGNPQILIFSTALITNIFIIITLYKYVKPFELGVFLYFGTVLFYVTMNGIRQSLVGAILFWSVRYISKSDWKRYFLIVVLVSTIHQSALIFLPLYFIAMKEAWSIKFWATLGISVALVAVFRPFLGFFAGLLDNTFYSNYSNDMMISSASVNVIRVFIALVPLVLAFLVRDRMQKEWPESNIYIFMSLFNFIFLMFSTQYLYFYRLCIYFELYNLILIPRLITFLPRKKSVVLYVYIIVFYLIFSWYQVNGWNDYYRNVLLQYVH